MHDKPTIPLHPSTKNLLGEPFGRLIVIEFAGYRNQGATWRCRCQEGNILVVQALNLLNGNTQSCGCLQIDRTSSHRKSNFPEYRIWIGMLQRCKNPQATKYHNYGGRGISVCQSWHTFENFYADMGPRPTPKHSLERVRNNEGYNPENCIWATDAIQRRNRRNNRMITYGGTTLCVADWALTLGIHVNTLRKRLQVWTIEKALTAPVDKTYSRVRKPCRLSRQPYPERSEY